MELALAARVNLGLEFAQWIGVRFKTQLGVTVANAILLPLNYALELGFFLAVGTLRLRQFVRAKVKANANELAAWTLVATSFLVGTFLRSSTIWNNDLGWRCFLPAQMVLLLWGAVIVHDWWFRGSSDAPEPAPGWWVCRALATLLIPGPGWNDVKDAAASSTGNASTAEKQAIAGLLKVSTGLPVLRSQIASVTIREAAGDQRVRRRDLRR